MTELGRMLREDGIQEGMEKGMEKAKIDVVRELLKGGLLTKEQIAKVTHLTLEKIKEIEEDIVAL